MSTAAATLFCKEALPTWHERVDASASEVNGAPIASSGSIL